MILPPDHGFERAADPVFSTLRGDVHVRLANLV